jgi:hypothetical protein
MNQGKPMDRLLRHQMSRRVFLKEASMATGTRNVHKLIRRRIGP